MAGSAVIGALRVNLGIDTAAFSDGLKQANTRLGKFGATLKTGLIGAAAAGTAAVGALGLAVKGTINAADEMAKTAASIGIPIEELSRLRYAADLSGVSFQGLQTAVGRLSRNMADAAEGTGEGAKAFEALGINVKNADGSLKSSSQVMAELSDKFAAMPDGAQKTALAMELMGRSGADMIPLLNGGATALNSMMAEADQFGQVFTAEMGANAELFNDNITRLKGAFANMGAELTERLLPILTQFTNWLVANAPAIAQNVAAVIEFAGAFVTAGINLTAFVTEKIGAFVSAIRALPGEMAQVGRDIIQGLWDGISGAWESVKGSVTGIASGIKSSFTDFFQIRSPSRVMMGVGENIVAGLNEGMSSMEGKAGGIAESIGSTIGNAFKGVIDGSKSVKDALKEVLSSLVSMMANKAFSMLFSGAAGGGGFVKSLFGGLIGFANGGSFKVGGSGGIDSQLVAFKASPNETVSVTKPGQVSGNMAGGAVDVHVMVDDEGALRAYVGRQTSASEARVMRTVPTAIDARMNQKQTRGTRAVR